MIETASVTRAELARMIDHTLLTPEATDADVARHCREAGLLGVGAVCISPPGCRWPRGFWPLGSRWTR